MSQSIITNACLVTGLPHLLLAPEQSPGWQKLNQAYGELRKDIAKNNPDVILYFSTQWLSVIGYLFQADPNPEWTYVDQEWHEHGSIHYNFNVDADFAHVYADEVRALGHNAAPVNYNGFPIDVGTIVAQKLLNPDNKIPAAMVSCNMYAEKEETMEIAKAATRALAKSNKRAAVVLVSNLSKRYILEPMEPKDDKISSAKDHEWNLKICELLGEGRLEDVSQCAREFAREANGDMGFKGIWWLDAVCGQSNDFKGKVYGYEPIWGTGGAVIGLTPTAAIGARAATPGYNANDDVSNKHASSAFAANVMQTSLAGTASNFDSLQPEEEKKNTVAQNNTAIHSQSTVNLPKQTATQANANQKSESIVHSSGAAEPVGAYPHARREGDFIFLSGLGPREKGKKEIPGATLDSKGNIVNYDVVKQTHAVVANLKAVLEDCGAGLENIVDIQVFLTNMQADFPAFNKVYAEYFAKIGPTRTTIEVGSLPTPIAVEFKVVAKV